MAHYYTRSNGSQVDISTMPFPHLRSSAEKLRREMAAGAQPKTREAELAAMDEEIVQRGIVYREELNTIIATSGDPEAVAKARDDLAKLDAQT
jgi:hypothetical protein